MNDKMLPSQSQDVDNVATENVGGKTTAPSQRCAIPFNELQDNDSQAVTRACNASKLQKKKSSMYY